MARQLNSSSILFRRTATSLMFCLGLSLTGLNVTQAAQPGHGRVVSVAGSPLQVSVPITGLTPDDLKVLSAAVAESAAWAQAGLSLPASIDSLSVSIEPGLNATTRNLVMRSTQAVNRPVIDMLIRLTTASGTTSIQSSYLVLSSDSPPKASGSVRVVKGDTLYAIALEKSVSGADIYQVMWSIYEANPQAFIADNMNLLRAGSSLTIPDAATMRAVDAKYARSMFAKHDQAFRARRGSGKAAVTVPTVATPNAQAGSVTSPPLTSKPTPTGDQVRLASTNPADQQADAKVASANELREMQSRVESLQKNVEELKEALQKSQAASGSVGATGASGPAGSSGSSGASGATGTAGATGTTGAIGATGATGASAASGKMGAEGTSSTGSNANTGTTASGEVKTGMAKLKQYASDHVLGFVLGISALLALIIAFLLKRAGRQARAEELDHAPQSNATVASNFDQKLQSIDLNLSADDKPSNAAGSSKTGV
jgi:pilus assembly protein FimV